MADKMTLMIVDDRPDNLLVLSSLVKEYFPVIEIFTASNAAEGIQLAVEKKLDGALIDVQMPGMDGIEMCRQLKNDSRTKNMALILLTAHNAAADLKARGLEAGADDFILRPFDNVEFVARIRVMLRIKRAEAELHVANQNLEDRVVDKIQQLRESEQRFRQISDNLQEWIWDVDVKGVYTYSSGNMNMLGYTHEEIVGKNYFFDFFPAEDREELKNIVFKQFATKQPFRDFINRNLTKNGEVVWFSTSGVPIFDSNGELIGYRGSDTNITERKQAEEQSLELEAQLHQKCKMEAVGILAGGMAHNFNNNLAIILGNLELLNLQKNLTVEAQGFLKNARIGTLRSRDLIQQIMAYSRSQQPKMVPTQLEPVITETLNLLRPMIPTSVYLQYNAAPESLETTVLADATRVQEALLNLCNNAVHAMDETGRLTIDLTTTALQKADISAEYSECLPGKFVRLRVQDTGCGMTDELINQIFDPFYTTKGVGEGTGMGLSTVQGMIIQIGGQIKLTSISGQGTTFDLYFPITDNKLQSSPEEKGQPLPRGTEHILFVDDDEMLASLGEQLLSTLGYQVCMMTDSAEALKMFAANADRFDLIISDQTMPNLTGKDLIAEIKKFRADIPTILCTGYSSKIDEEEAAKLGISAFMMKPLDLPHLSQTIRQVLDGDKEM